MRTVNIGELKDQLSGYLQYVRSGQEVVVRDRNRPIARIVPFDHGTEPDAEAQLVASGAMTMPKEPIKWDAFFKLPAGKASRRAAVRAVIDARGDR